MKIWSLYSKKCLTKVEFPKNGGSFKGQERGMHVAEGTLGSKEEGALLAFSFLVDPEDGMIVDAKFQAFGPTALIAAAEATCDLVIHKYYDQARRVGAELIDRHLRDKNDVSAIPEQAVSFLNLAVDVLDLALATCSSIPLPGTPSMPAPKEIEVRPGGYPGFETLSPPSQLAVIQEVIQEEVRPYIELDGGGVDVLQILNGKEVIIHYSGACTTCFSSTGATLAYIQQILQAKVHPSLIVVPHQFAV